MANTPPTPPTKRDFDALAGTWEQGDLRATVAAAMSAAIRRHMPLDASMHLLDFGAGTGMLSRPLLPHIGKLTALDSSEKMLMMLTAAVPPMHTEQVAAIFGDITAPPPEFEGAFDGIISSMALHHIADTAALLRQLHRCCKPGGFIALADLRSEGGTFHGGDNTGVEHFGFDEEALLAQTRAAGFDDAVMRTAQTVEKAGVGYDLFLLTGRRR